MSEYLFPFHKKKYIKGRNENNTTECILCESLKKDSTIPSLIVCHTPLTAVCINLYPYNSGHLMIFPKRHLADIRVLSPKEEQEITTLSKNFMDIIDGLYHPSGYNVGYNLGESSGASISHIHRHIIPRYANEIGIVELIGGSKVLIEDPKTTLKLVTKAAQKFKFQIENIIF